MTPIVWRVLVGLALFIFVLAHAGDAIAQQGSNKQLQVPERIEPWPPRKIDLPKKENGSPPKPCVPGICKKWGQQCTTDTRGKVTCWKVCEEETTCP